MQPALVAPFSTTDPSTRDDTRLPHSRSTLTCPGIFFVFTNITPESSTLPRSHHRLQDLRQVVQLFQLCLPSLRCTSCKIKQHLCCTHVGTRPCQDSKVKSPSPSLEMLILEHHVTPLTVQGGIQVFFRHWKWPKSRHDSCRGLLEELERWSPAYHDPEAAHHQTRDGLFTPNLAPVSSPEHPPAL